MKKFKNKVAMLVTMGQYRELKPKFIELGYKDNQLNDEGEKDDHPYILTNHWMSTREGTMWIINRIHIHAFELVLEDYNEDLFLALCAQSHGNTATFNCGEYVVVNGEMKRVEIQYGPYLYLEGKHMVDVLAPRVTVIQPSVESLTKHFTRKAKRAEKIEAIRNEIKHLQSCDWLNAVDLNITGREPVKVLREYAKEAASAAHSTKSDIEFAKDFESILRLKKMNTEGMATKGLQGIDLAPLAGDGSKPMNIEDYVSPIGCGKILSDEPTQTPLKPRPAPIPRVNRTELDKILEEIAEWNHIKQSYQYCDGDLKAVIETINYRIKQANNKVVELIEKTFVPF